MPVTCEHQNGVDRGQETRSGVSSTVNLPLVNISNVTLSAGQQLLDALIKYGFVYIDTRGTDFTPEVVDRQFELSRQFYNSSAEEKQSCKIGAGNRGWSGMHSETLDPAHQKRGDFKEAFNLGEFINEKPQQSIPKSLQGHERELFEFEARCRKMCNQVFELLALGLEIPDLNWFSSRHTTPSGSTLRFLYYPAVPKNANYQPDVDIRAGAHSDYGSITLLFQRPSQPGLEIQTSDRKWSSVPVIPTGYQPEFSAAHSSNSKGNDNEYKDKNIDECSQAALPPILLNIGDCLSYWTNGLLLSTVHRVVFPSSKNDSGSDSNNSSSTTTTTNAADHINTAKDRYSIVYFAHPADSVPLEAVPSSLVTERRPVDRVGYGGGVSNGPQTNLGNGEKNIVMTAKELLRRRLEATYGFKHD